jgi:hypothetical protein
MKKNREQLLKEFHEKNSGQAAYQVFDEEEAILDAYLLLHEDNPTAIKEIFREYKSYKQRQTDDLYIAVKGLIEIVLRYRKGGKKKTNDEAKQDMKIIAGFIQNLGKHEKASWNTFKKKYPIGKLPVKKSKFHELIKPLLNEIKKSVR